MKALKEAYSSGWKSLVCSHKYDYNTHSLGMKVFPMKNHLIHRKDFVLKNEDK